MKKEIKYTAWAGFGVLLHIIIYNALKLPEPALWAMRIIILFILYKFSNKVISYGQIDKIGLITLILFMSWQIISFIRGSFDAGNNYWIWKNITTNLLISLFYIFILYATNPLWVSYTYKLLWNNFFILLIIGFIFCKDPLIVNYLPYSTMLLLWPAIPQKHKYRLLLIIFFFLITNTQRNDLAKIIFALLCGIIIYKLYQYIPTNALKYFHFLLLVTPFILLALAIHTKFNVFRFEDYIKGEHIVNRTENGISKEENLLTDTRTFIYQNTFYTMNKYDSWLWGRNTAHGDEGFSSYIDRDTGIKGRNGNEVGILNILLWHGLLGVTLNFILYARASFLAIYKSKNKYLKIIGIYTAFLWCWGFIWERCLFEMFYLMNIIFIGICLSSTFRKMTNMEFKKWVVNCIYK